MSISDTKKSVIIYMVISVILVIFNAAYESFSYGEYSYYMRGMFLVPLLMGSIFLFLYRLLHKNWKMHRVAFLLWNSAMAIFVSGCMVRGIIEISGRSTDYGMYYFIGGSIFALFALVCMILKK